MFNNRYGPMSTMPSQAQNPMAHRTMPTQSAFGDGNKFGGMMPGSPEHRAAAQALGGGGGMGDPRMMPGQGFNPQDMARNVMQGMGGGFDPSRFPQQALQNGQGLDAVRQRMGK